MANRSDLGCRDDTFPSYSFVQYGIFLLLGLAPLLASCTSYSSRPVSDTPRPSPVSETGRPDYQDTVSPEGRYLFYLHGKIIEDQGPNAISPEYGAYEYAVIVESFERAGFEVISAVRGPSTDVDEYSDLLVRQVRALLEAGVAPERITIAGFSKGAVITLLASSKLDNPGLNFVVMAICYPELLAMPRLALAGRFLSLYEETDILASSCQPLIAGSPDVTEFSEVVLSTGKGHGAFYSADPEWLDQVISWGMDGE